MMRVLYDKVRFFDAASQVSRNSATIKQPLPWKTDVTAHNICVYTTCGYFYEM
mgnify:FL=1